MLDERGVKIGAFALCTDITERKRAEQELAYRLTFQADRTLTEADVDAAFGAVVAA